MPDLQEFKDKLATDLYSMTKEERDVCDYYPKPEDDSAVCACNSDISGKFVCTKKYSESCQWAIKRRQEEKEDS